MNIKPNLLRACALAFLLALPGLVPHARAQAVAGAPAYVDYQGTVYDANNKPLGSDALGTTAVPTNYTLQFKVYDQQSGGTLIYAETQTVTVSLGAFSVRLGSGAQIPGLTPAPSKTSLADAFLGKDRYLELTVIDAGTGLGTPITPRLAFQSSPFSLVAERAKSADSVSGVISAGSSFAGAVTATGSTFSGGTFGTVGAPATFVGSLSGTATNVSGVVSVANGGTGSAVQNFVDLTTNQSIGGTKTFNNNINVFANALTAVQYAGVFTTGIAGNGLAVYCNTTDLSKVVFKAESNAGGMFVMGNGKVGMGTSSPTAKLEVIGLGTALPSTTGIQSTGLVQRLKGNTNASLDIGSADNSGFWLQATSTADLGIKNPLLLNPNGGNVGIGTTSPEVPLDVVGSSWITMDDNGYDSSFTFLAGTNYVAFGAIFSGGGGNEHYGMTGPGNLPPNSSATAPVGIRADGWIATARGLVVYSDRRIKRDMQASPTAKDLAAIQQLQVTDYRMVDPADGGNSWRKGFIAQEVEKVLPGAVMRSPEFVPDIFSVATNVVFDPAVKTLALTLTKDHGLKTGDRVRLHIDGKRVDLNVSAVPSARTFVVTDCPSGPQKVLVYGKQVADFRTVDYDRIFTTAVGALQQLKTEKDTDVAELRKKNDALQEQNTLLSARLAALEAKDQARDAKLAAIERQLLSTAQPAIRAASLQINDRAK